MGVSERLRKRRLARVGLLKATQRNRLIQTLKVKKTKLIDRALKRGNQKEASDVVATTVVIHDALKVGRALEAAGHEDVEPRVLNALADCVNAMESGEDPFKVEKETLQEKQEREKYLIVSALQGRRGRGRDGGNVIVDADEVVDERKYFKELRRATAAGERKPRYQGPTMATHELAVKTIVKKNKKRIQKRSQRIARYQKAAGVATPQYCQPAGVRGDGVPLFRSLFYIVARPGDNRPLIAAEAAARALRHYAEKGRTTLAEKQAKRRARLPDKVYASRTKTHAGQYHVTFNMNKSYSAAIREKFKTAHQFSVAKPGTDGHYASTKAAAEVRDEWIELKRPESWLVKHKR